MSNDASTQEPTCSTSEDEKLLEMASDFLRSEEENEKQAQMMQDDNPVEFICETAHCCVCDGYCSDNDVFDEIETENCEVDIQDIEPSIQEIEQNS